MVFIRETQVVCRVVTSGRRCWQSSTLPKTGESVNLAMTATSVGMLGWRKGHSISLFFFNWLIYLIEIICYFLQNYSNGQVEYIVGHSRKSMSIEKRQHSNSLYSGCWRRCSSSSDKVHHRIPTARYFGCFYFVCLSVFNSLFSTFTSQKLMRIVFAQLKSIFWRNVWIYCYSAGILRSK